MRRINNSKARVASGSAAYRVERNSDDDEVRITPLENVEEVPVRSTRTLSSVNGVDVFYSGTGQFLVRFRADSAARELGIQDLTAAQFCHGPAKQLTQAALDEISAVKDLTTQARAVFSQPAFQNAPTLAIFGGDHFKDTFGKEFKELSSAAGWTLLQRLKTCLLFDQDENLRQALEATILQEVQTAGLVAELRVDLTWSRKRPISFTSNPARIAQEIAAAELRLTALEKQLVDFHPEVTRVAA